MKWFLVTFKDGTRVETLAPHHRTARAAHGDKVLFMREIKDGKETEKNRYYNPTSRQSKKENHNA